MEDVLRSELVALLQGGGGHCTFDQAVADFPEAAQGVVPAGLDHSAWQVVDHLRFCQRDILDYMVADHYQTYAFPDDYWLPDPAPPDAEAWAQSIEAFRRNLAAVQAIAADAEVDVFARVPHGPHTVLREVLLVADHNAYHIGQLVHMRALLGIGNEAIF